MPYDVTNPPPRPDPGLTPGAVDSRVTVALALTRNFTYGFWHSNSWVPREHQVLGDTPVRNVPVHLATHIWHTYFPYRSRKEFPHAFEIDHLIPLHLGGSNAPENLWPQPSSLLGFNAAAKDELELHLLAKLADIRQLDGDVAAAQALLDWQAQFAADWTVLYAQNSPPLSTIRPL